MPGCESLSHAAGSSTGVIVLHGLTGSPWSVCGVADAMIAAGHDVELPRLPGHGTRMSDILATGWTDWTGEVERVHRALRERTERVVVIGQSMGATLALWVGLEYPDVAGLVCINPVTRARDAATMAMIDEFIDDGLEVVPGEGSDIADPDSSDIGYDGTPIRPLRSLLVDGIGSMSGRFGELRMPLQLVTSRQDHVVEPADSEYLAATYGGPVDHI